MPNLPSQAVVSRAAWKLALLGALGVLLVGGGGKLRHCAADGAELVPFRGVEPFDSGPEVAVQEEGPRLGVPAAPMEGSALVLDQLRLAVLALGREDLVGAKSKFLQVLELQPDHLSALVNLGWIAQREKSWVEANEYLKRAQKLAPDNAAVWLALGLVALEQKRLEFAHAAFAQVVALDPKHARAHRLLGLTLCRKGWYSGAEEELRRSLELEPDDAGAHFNLAVLYLQRQPAARELARRHYYRALDLGSAPDTSIANSLVDNVSVSSPPSSAKPPVSVH